MKNHSGAKSQLPLFFLQMLCLRAVPTQGVAWQFLVLYKAITSAISCSCSACNWHCLSGTCVLVSVYGGQDGGGALGVLWTFIEKARYEKVPVILVGNKVDLESEREVSLSEGRALAEEWGCPFMETSAKSKTMVDELFAEIVRQMNYAAQPDKDDPCCSACNIQ
ncbi:ras-related protein Rap-2a isoform X2 [Corapipo altera]|uniref:ras-related protein Rap-2a isoform X2 n=1 Tax=Corapipo altera TaxID=415028 RepID=UPI000FD65CD8|nr:ras-related protein Rap-2a isoform X2 [Corapipo altera]